MFLQHLMSVIPHSYMATVRWNWKVTLLFIWGMCLQGTQGILLARFVYVAWWPLETFDFTTSKHHVGHWRQAWLYLSPNRKKNWVGVWLRMCLLFFLYSFIHLWSLLLYPLHHKSLQNSLHWTCSVLRLEEAGGGKVNKHMLSKVTAKSQFLSVKHRFPRKLGSH